MVVSRQAQLSWIVPGQIAATSLPSGRDVAEMRAAGITLLVSVAPMTPDARQMKRAGLRCMHLPVAYMRAPGEQQLRDFVSTVKDELDAGGKVAVHCVGGLGRTGTVIACYLVSGGMSPDEAIAFVRQRRPGAVESDEQAKAVYRWAAGQMSGYTAGAAQRRARGSYQLRTAEGGPWATTPQKEGKVSMARSGATGYLRWEATGSAVDLRALPSTSRGGPRVEDLKSALTSFQADGQVTVTLTETLGQGGEAWITVSCPPGRQAGLLMATGQIVDLLVRAGVYEEVLLSAD